ncbi:DUF4124 domain-containing protein [Hahella chejuensis]|nr:DUF4124 domain-containing protein [Hahella chejuensis]
MKWIFRFLTLASLGVALALPFFIKDKTGSPMWRLPLPEGTETPTLMTMDKKLPEQEVVRQVYKWRDAEGVLQYSDAPPPEGVNVDVISVSNKTNIIQSVPTEKKEEPQVATGSPRDALPPETRKTLEDAENKDTLSFERALNLMDEAKAVRDLMNERNKQLQQVNGG